MTLADAHGALIIVGMVGLSTLCSELASYVLVYRNDDYKRLCDRVRELNKKLAKEDAKIVSADKRKAHEKGIERIEDDLKLTTTRMDAQKFKTNILSAVAFFFLYRMVARSWDGIVVARLPFTPIKLVEGLSRRGLTTDNNLHCGYGFIYTLCTIGVKANIPKLLGFVAPKSAFDAARIAARQQRKESRE